MECKYINYMINRNRFFVRGFLFKLLIFISFLNLVRCLILMYKKEMYLVFLYNIKEFLMEFFNLFL